MSFWEVPPVFEIVHKTAERLPLPWDVKSLPNVMLEVGVWEPVQSFPPTKFGLQRFHCGRICLSISSFNRRNGCFQGKHHHVPES